MNDPSESAASVMSWMASLLDQIMATSLLEYVAVALAIAYLILAIRQSIWCWPCALVSTAIYVHLFYDVALLSESALNVFYLVMAVYGWWQWQQGGNDRSPGLPISRLHPKWHVVAVLSIAALVWVTGSQMSQKTEAVFPYLDAATTWSAVWATWLTARKILENWYYWLIIDLVSIGLYATKGLALTAVLFALYVVLVFVGLREWTKRYRMQVA
ncbi:MAG: nicotinamide riboside transporter PnuC [Pseudomonadota bacterium]